MKDSLTLLVHGMHPTWIFEGGKTVNVFFPTVG